MNYGYWMDWFSREQRRIEKHIEKMRKPRNQTERKILDWYVEIDGELHKVDGVYDESLRNGCFYGANEETKPSDKVRSVLPSGKYVATVSAWWHTPGGGVDGVEGFFKFGEWATHPDNGCPVFKVSERIA